MSKFNKSILYIKPKPAAVSANDEFIGDYAFQMPTVPISPMLKQQQQQTSTNNTNNNPKLVTFSCAPSSSSASSSSRSNKPTNLKSTTKRVHYDDENYVDEEDETLNSSDENYNYNYLDSIGVSSSTSTATTAIAAVNTAAAANSTSLKKTSSDLILEYNKKFLEKNVDINFCCVFCFFFVWDILQNCSFLFLLIKGY